MTIRQLIHKQFEKLDQKLNDVRSELDPVEFELEELLLLNELELLSDKLEELKEIDCKKKQNNIIDLDSLGNGMAYLLYYLNKRLAYRNIAEKMKEKGFTGFSIARLNNKKQKLIAADLIDDDCNLTEKGKKWIEKTKVDK